MDEKIIIVTKEKYGKIKGKLKEKFNKDKLIENSIFLINYVVITTFYLVPLLMLSPYLDNLFGPLNKDRSYFYILRETTLHLITLVFFYVYKRKLIDYILKKIYKNTDFNLYYQDILLGFISSIILVGSQQNLITKIQYLNTLTINFEMKHLIDNTNIF
tara:strand:+ start:182 stop:658 length:477 start_codon:yes stop_codon:yes gene_type:complete